MAFTAMTDEDRIRTAIDQVEQVCPGSARHVAAARTIAWASEPYTQGSYVAFKPGEVTAFWAQIREEVGPLVIAGEHIAVHQGYMEGAVESGERAAQICEKIPSCTCSSSPRRSLKTRRTSSAP
jgi:monoamine oxidase